MAEPLFHEEQKLRQARPRVLTAILPAGMTLLLIWQVVLGHPWGRQPLSNASVIGWTIFVWIIYLRLMTIKLVTDVSPGEVCVAMRGLWRSVRISLTGVKSIQAVTFDAAADWGGYGIRQTKRGRAYIAGGNQGVELEMPNGSIVLIGSERSNDLARRLEAAR